MASWYWSFSLKEETESGVAKKDNRPLGRRPWTMRRPLEQLRIAHRERCLEAGQALNLGVSGRTAVSRKSPRGERLAWGKVTLLHCALETGLSSFPRVRGQASQHTVDFLDLAPLLLPPQGKAGQEV